MSKYVITEKIYDNNTNYNNLWDWFLLEACEETTPYKVIDIINYFRRKADDIQKYNLEPISFIYGEGFYWGEHSGDDVDFNGKESVRLITMTKTNFSIYEIEPDKKKYQIVEVTCTRTQTFSTKVILPMDIETDRAVSEVEDYEHNIDWEIDGEIDGDVEYSYDLKESDVSSDHIDKFYDDAWNYDDFEDMND